MAFSGLMFHAELVQSVVLILETSKNIDISLLLQNLIAKWNQDRNDF